MIIGVLSDTFRFSLETPAVYWRPPIFIGDTSCSLETPLYSLETPAAYWRPPIRIAGPLVSDKKLGVSNKIWGISM